MFESSSSISVRNPTCTQRLVRRTACTAHCARPPPIQAGAVRCALPLSAVHAQRHEAPSRSKLVYLLKRSLGEEGGGGLCRAAQRRLVWPQRPAQRHHRRGQALDELGRPPQATGCLAQEEVRQRRGALLAQHRRGLVAQQALQQHHGVLAGARLGPGFHREQPPRQQRAAVRRRQRPPRHPEQRLALRRVQAGARGHAHQPLLHQRLRVVAAGVQEGVQQRRGRRGLQGLEPGSDGARHPRGRTNGAPVAAEHVLAQLVEDVVRRLRSAQPRHQARLPCRHRRHHAVQLLP
mmetsp:Transcript_36986/g.95928  ORF Transcript_36986/g.95928 Transcript_36986/m.95928 type:complete len:292 (-) Transcript_36986:830-1705(-)